MTNFISQFWYSDLIEYYQYNVDRWFSATTNVLSWTAWRDPSQIPAATTWELARPSDFSAH
jgi:hypothetical protein